MTVDALIGKTLVDLHWKCGLVMKTDRGIVYRVPGHVYDRDICGNPRLILGSPVLSAEERHSDQHLFEKEIAYRVALRITDGVKLVEDDWGHWSFLKLSTDKGSIECRLYGIPIVLEEMGGPLV